MPKVDSEKPVRNVRAGPQARADSAAVLEGESVLIDVAANDLAANASSLWGLVQDDMGILTEEGDTIWLDSGASISFVGGQVLYDAGTAFDYLGAGEIAEDSFTYSIRMANGRVSYATVTVTITGDNTPPDPVDDAFAVSESGTTILDVLANDTDDDADPLTVVSVTQPVEGSVSIDGLGNVVFDPGTTFAGLSVGQTATVEFEYTISDGSGGSDTATAVITVQGEGVFTPPIVSDSETTTLVNGQDVTLTLSGEGQTNDGDASITIEVGLGLVAQPIINIFYVIDISGSTQGTFAGTPVGDVNGDGRPNTVLDAEIASLLALTAEIQSLGFPPGNVTVTIVPFNNTADPTTVASAGGAFSTTTFSSGNIAGINSYLTGLDYGGTTNYEAALDSVLAELAVLDPTGTENNFVYFLSDGIPTVPSGTIAQRIAAYTDEVQDLIVNYGAQISGIGLDGSATPLDPQFLNALDNTGGAQFVNNTDALGAALLGSPIPSGSVTDLVLTVDGVVVAEIDETDLVSGPFGLSINTSVDELSPYLGDDSEVLVQITFDDGSVLDATITVDGVLPASYDI
ncbi:MAG: cadherin-like domain-containing protein [Erythrobacter sp.]|nr:MAG: cadherin-like domain-containing protein [Erythrobacter sp.]